MGNLQAISRSQRQAAIEEEMLPYKKQRMGLEVEHLAKQNLMLEEQAKQMERQRKEAEAFVPVSAVAPQLANFPELSAHWESAVKESGYVVKEMAGEKFVQAGGIKVIGNLMGTNMDFAKKSLELTKAGIEKQLMNISQQMNNPEEPPKGKDLENLQAQKVMLQKQMADVISSEFEFNKQMILRQKESRAPNEAGIKAGLAGPQALETFKETERELQKSATEQQSEMKKVLIDLKGKAWFDKATDQQKLDVYSKYRAGTVTREPRAPSTFDKQFASAIKSLKEKGITKPTEEQIAKELHKLYPKQLENWILSLMGGNPGDPLKLSE